MMKNAKAVLMIFIMMFVCCSYSFGQQPIAIGARGLIQMGVPGTIGMISDGAGVYPATGINPAGGISNAYLGGTRPSLNITLNEFVCVTMASCGIYPPGIVNNCDGGVAYTGGVTSGATVPVTKL
ncbi:MAG: hypothetical protein ACE14P_12115 [Methanotrichaceae archaeon]